MDKIVLMLACTLTATGLISDLGHAEAADASRIGIDLDAAGRAISPTLWGVFFEDINHAADGGIYAEMLANRAFDDTLTPERCSLKGDKLVTPNQWESRFPTDDPMPAWTPVREGSVRGTAKLDDTVALNKAHPRSCRVDITKGGEGRVGVANLGYWGVAIKKGETYRLNAFIKSTPTFQGPLNASLENGDGQVFATQQFALKGDGWAQYSLDLKSDGDETEARFVLSASAPGTFWLGYVSLFPEKTWKNRENGLKPHLMEMLAGLKPAFLRFPGGCIVEGFTYETAIRWKRTIGPVHERPGQWNLWGYRSSNGVGYHEYLQMCEDLGAEPLFVINCGMTCQGRGCELVPMDRLDEWVQDALDAIEYANGPADSQWGAVRAAAGHPEPFNLKYFEIGNENSGKDYDARYKVFHDAIRARYPEIRLIANVHVEGASYDILDEHFYDSPTAMAGRSTQYDTRERGKADIYVGEYAVVAECGKGNLRGALAEAAFMTGMERNSDLVKFASYAPLFVNVHDRAWNPDAICFDNTRVYGTPSYHAQKMFSHNRGDLSYPVTVTCATEEVKQYGRFGLATWDTQADYKDVKVSRGDKVLFDGNAPGTDSAWQPGKGDWKVKDGVITQSASGTDFRAIAGETDWSDYTISLKARKNGGAEGFMVMFNVRDDKNWTWCNFGGWGNRSHGIETCINGAKGQMAQMVNGTIETGQWYDIRVEVAGKHVRSFLDGKLIHDTQYPANPHLAASAAYDKTSEEIILKVVNRSDKPKQTEVSFTGSRKLAETALCQILSGIPEAENTLENPEAVSPQAATIEGIGNTFTHAFAASSLTVMRIKTK